ncbi:Protein SAWADEE HOMEODOMAIN-like 2 [Quillaja saponaria]|uniref:Protein SAWADEE HOMEODOMAIN-like 2 n=1 Tax=Quillaja saponaria TaxID=32244 RepID=A0AAD7PAR5_QUISA|nr:Protein SAWADEE HOMEODOMAIN-like 2 [Quillaja saponaria]
MGRPPSNGGPAFRFTQAEVAEMEAILQEHNNAMPAREVITSLAEKFSESPDRKGKITVQMKQVWNWFQNKRYAVRARSSKAPGKLNVTPMPRDDSASARNMSQPLAAPTPAATVPNTGRVAPENSIMEFEAKSGRDGAWYDVANFLSHRYLETSDPEVLVRFSGFGPEEDEWINIQRHVRPRSLPCESSECVAVLPGDLILCFQEGKEQALYFDAHVLDAQRRRHDVRGCRCRFLVRYDHDQSEEIVPLRKVCRRPETDYRLQQLHAVNEAVAVDQHKTSMDVATQAT